MARHGLLLRLSALTLGASLLAGCASLSSYPRSPFDRKQELAALQPWLGPAVLNTYHDTPETKRRSYRDEVIQARVRAINITFDEFERALQVERKTGDIGTDWAVLALNGAATLITPTTTKSILSTVSGGVVGAKGSVDKNLFFEKTMPVLLSQMEANRAEVLVRIRAGMAKDIDVYPLPQALLDCDDYFKAGTMLAALTAMNASSGQSIKASAEQLRVSEGTFVKDDAAARLRAFWKPAGKDINPENEKALSDWKAKNHVEDSVPFFLRASQHAAAREQAVRDLNLK